MEKHNAIFALIHESEIDLIKKFDKLLEKLLFKTLGIQNDDDLMNLIKRKNVTFYENV